MLGWLFWCFAPYTFGGILFANETRIKDNLLVLNNATLLDTETNGRQNIKLDRLQTSRSTISSPKIAFRVFTNTHHARKRQSYRHNASNLSSRAKIINLSANLKSYNSTTIAQNISKKSIPKRNNVTHNVVRNLVHPQQLLPPQNEVKTSPQDQKYQNVISDRNSLNLLRKILQKNSQVKSKVVINTDNGKVNNTFNKKLKSHTFKETLTLNAKNISKNDTANMTSHINHEHDGDQLEKRECCHYYDHGHDLMEMHNNPHHYDGDFLHGGAHDEYHSIEEHGDRTDFGDGPEPSHFMNNQHGGGGGGFGGGGGGYGGEGGGNHHIHETPHYYNYQPSHQYTDVHNEPHYHHQNFFHQPHYHEHFHHNEPHFEHNDYHYIDDHHEHFHHQPHYVNNEVHIHHDNEHYSEPEEYHHGSGERSNHGHFHHVKVGLHGPGKSPSQWSHQEQGENQHMDDSGGEDELNNYDTGAGFFQLDERGGEVDITSLHKSGTKVHMGGGQFSVIRDPWRFHSAFAGLFHPHETMGANMGGGMGGFGGGGGGGGGGVQQFHQHFTYINNERNEKTKVQNLVHHEHEGEAAATEHHYSEHHDDHHLHHEHEHRGHHDDHHDEGNGNMDIHGDHERHHHHHEEDEDHHHYEEHHADALHGHGDGGGGGGGGVGGGGGGGSFAYTRDTGSYKVYPGTLTNGEEQAHGTPTSDNYRSDRTPSVTSEKRTVDQITPGDASDIVGGSGDVVGSKRGNLATVGSNDTPEELTIDDDIKDDLTLSENKDIVKKIYFNNLIHEDHGGDPDDNDDDNNDDEGVKIHNDGVSNVSSGSGGEGEASKRKEIKSNGKEEISGNGPLDPQFSGPEAGITGVFVEPMVVRRDFISNNEIDGNVRSNQRMEYFQPIADVNTDLSDKVVTSSNDLSKKNSLLRKIELFKRKFLSSVAS